MLRNEIEGVAHTVLLRLPKPIVKKLKLIAIDQDKSVQRLIREILEQYLNRKQE